jgi:glycosyltransferase involved in cell wall biosynthesis
MFYEMPAKPLIVLNHMVSVIIPVYNGRETLYHCLNSIFKSSYPYFECIVVDDNSTDNTISIAETFDTKIIRLDVQKGSAYARNRGSEDAQGDILLFVDADVTIYPDSLYKVAKAFEEYPDISALFGSYDDKPGRSNFLSQYKNLFHHYIHQTSQEDASTFWSGCGAVKRTVFHEVGGFDQDKYSKPCIEDIEMGCRLSKLGHRILLYKNLQVKHLKHFSFFNLVKSDLFDRAIPWTTLMLNNKQLASDLNLKTEHRLSAGILILIIVSILFSVKSIWFLSVIPGLLLVFFVLNRDFYRFFLYKKSYVFTLQIIPFHFLYYLYSTLGFLMGFCKYLYDKHFYKLKNTVFIKGA